MSSGADAGLISSQQLGDVVGFEFPGEAEVALFVPGSGDVLLCHLDQWSQLKKFSNTAHGHDMATSDSELVVMLRTLGASIA